MGKYIQCSLWMKMGAIVIGALFYTSMFGQDVSDMEFRQDGKRVIISYSLNKSATVSVFVSTDGGLSFGKALQKVEGDVGNNVSPGENTILWSPLDEVNAIQGDDITFQIRASPAVLGESVLIDGLWWASVNVGHTTKNPYGLLFNWGKDEGFKYLSTGQSYRDGNWQSQDQGPCSEGWRIPTRAEYKNLLTAANSPVGPDGGPGLWRSFSVKNPNGLAGRWFGPDCLTATVTTPGNSVFFPAAGYWIYNDRQFRYKSSRGYYWSSDSGRYMYFRSGAAFLLSVNVRFGFSVRCVKD